MHFQVAVCIEHVELLGYRVDRHIRIKGNFQLSFLSVLGRNDDYTIGGHRTVNGSGGTIFQDFHGFDILRIDGVDVTRIPVDDVKRLIVTHSLDTTDFYRNACTCITSRFQNAYTGNFTLQCFGCAGSGTLHQIFRFHRRNGTGHITLLHRTVTYDYDFIQHFRIIFQCYFDVLLPVEGNFLGYITHIRDYHSCFGRDCQRKVAVNVGDATITGSFFQDTGTDKRFSFGIGYGTG